MCGGPSTLCPEISQQSPAPTTMCARPALFFARPVTMCGSPFTLSPSQRLYRRFSDPVSRFRESLRLKTGRTRSGSSKFKAESRRDGIFVATAERESPQLRRSGIGPHMPPLRGLVASRWIVSTTIPLLRSCCIVPAELWTLSFESPPPLSPSVCIRVHPWLKKRLMSSPKAPMKTGQGRCGTSVVWRAAEETNKNSSRS